MGDADDAMFGISRGRDHGDETRTLGAANIPASTEIMSNATLIAGQAFLPNGKPYVTTGQEELVRTLLAGIGADVESEGMRDTPRRWMEMLLEFFQHRDTDLATILKTGFEPPEDDSQMVVQRLIPARMLCEHHLAPAFGHVAIGYIPRECNVGLSKLARLVDAAGTQSPTTQERMTHVIARTLMKTLAPAGVIVVSELVHSCMSVRGAKVPGVPTIVSSIHGAYRDNSAARQEFFSLVNRK